MKKRVMFVLIVVALCVSLLSCSAIVEDEKTAGTSSGTDTESEAVTDTATGTFIDPSTDTGTDTGIATVDETDTGVSTGTGGSTDTGITTVDETDTGISTGTGGGTDTGIATDTGISTATGSSTDTGIATDTGISTATADTDTTVVGCVEGTTRCLTRYSYEACQSDQTWGSSTSCASDQICDSVQDKCVQACLAGTTRCAGQYSIETCQPDRTWGSSTSCASDEFCATVLGACVECLPGTFKCSGNSVYACTGAGHWGTVPVATCGIGSTCRADGNGWACESSAKFVPSPNLSNLHKEDHVFELPARQVISPCSSPMGQTVEDLLDIAAGFPLA